MRKSLVIQGDSLSGLFAMFIVGSMSIHDQMLQPKPTDDATRSGPRFPGDIFSLVSFAIPLTYVDFHYF